VNRIKEASDLRVPPTFVTGQLLTSRNAENERQVRIVHRRNDMSVAPASFGATHFGTAVLGDKRRTDCLVRIADGIHRHPGGTLPHKLHQPNDYKAMVRLMNRPEVTHATVLRPHHERTLQRMRQASEPVLVLHDSTELDYSGLTSIQDLGPIGNGGCRGLLCHNSVAFDPQRHEVVGLAHQILHRRVVGKGEGVRAKRERKTRESRLWVDGLRAIGPAPPEKRWVHVADRGADTFEVLAQVMAAGQEFVIRSHTSRSIWVGHEPRGQRQRLHRYAASLPLQGQHEIVVPARAGVKGRRAVVGVAFAPVLIRPPHVRRGEYVKRPLAIWVVRVRELKPPRFVKAVEWLLLTNVPATSEDEAWQRVDWYACRWVIEEYHKAMKTGCAMEDLQFATSQALEPMIGLLSVVAGTLLQLREASRRPDAQTRPATDIVDVRYVAVLSGWRCKQMRTDWSVHEFFYALARLGGHQNRKRDHRPGWLILWRGWMDLQHMVDGAEAVGFTSCG
jgi:Transposase DNA-binding